MCMSHRFPRSAIRQTGGLRRNNIRIGTRRLLMSLPLGDRDRGKTIIVVVLRLLMDKGRSNHTRASIVLRSPETVGSRGSRLNITLGLEINHIWTCS